MTPGNARCCRSAQAIGVLQSAGLRSFAFAGYARIATLGEEVRDPRTTIPRAIPLALGPVVTISIYAVVSCVAVAVTLPLVAVAGGAVLLVAGSAAWAATRSRRQPAGPDVR